MPEKQKKILFTSHIANFSKFNLPYMRWFRQQGWKVHYASLGEEEITDCDKQFSVPFNRSPYSPDNFRAYRQLKKIIYEEDYSSIHCHTPMGGVVTRLAARQARKNGAKVFYTAHGFHFFEGAPMQSWLLYYPVEKLLSRWTDCLVLINDEDCDLAIKKHFPAQRIEKLDGVGVDFSRFHPADRRQRAETRDDLNLGPEDFVLLYTAEFIPRKNHQFLLENFARLLEKIPSARLLLAGKGSLLESSRQLCNTLGVVDVVQFLGYRQDVDCLCHAADVLVSTSRQEGLPINVIEGMASGLPVVCTAIRGQTDLVAPGENGYLFDQGNGVVFRQALQKLYENPALCSSMGAQNVQDAKRYSVQQAVARMAAIYRQVLGEG